MKNLWNVAILVLTVAVGSCTTPTLFRRSGLELRDKFFDAIMYDDVDDAKALLAQHPWLIHAGSPPIRVSSGLSIYDYDEPPLTVAVMCTSTNAFEWLLSCGVGVNEGRRHGHPPIVHALGRRYFLQRLLEAGADPRTKGLLGESVIELAVRTHRTNDIETIMQNWPRPNRQTGDESIGAPKP